MLQIRFNREGKKNRAHFRIVLQEHTVAPGGKHVEILGSYDPHTKVTTLKEDRITYWISKGAQTTDRVHNLLITKGLLEGKKRAVKMKRPVEKQEEIKEAPNQGGVLAEKQEEIKESSPEEKKAE